MFHRLVDHINIINHAFAHDHIGAHRFLFNALGALDTDELNNFGF